MLQQVFRAEAPDAAAAPVPRALAPGSRSTPVFLAFAVACLAAWPETWLDVRQVVTAFTKKVVVAGSPAPVVDPAFASSARHPSGVHRGIVRAAFARQIHADVSGHTDTARALSRAAARPCAPDRASRRAAPRSA